MNKINLSLACALIASFATMGISTIHTFESSSYEYLDTELQKAKNFTIEVIQNMPAEDFSFKPGDEMRTFAAQAYHIAYSMEWFNGNLSGNPIQWNPGDENRLEKDALIEYTTEQFDRYIDLLMEAEVTDQTTASVLSFLQHNAHHRGQMVAYYRANGMVPPSYPN